MIFTSDGVTGFQGSGFFVSKGGVAVSNYHVFKGTTKGLENIKLTDGRILKIKEVLGYAENLDYIILVWILVEKMSPIYHYVHLVQKLGIKRMLLVALVV